MNFRNTDLPVSERVSDLIGRLSLEEKAGQLIMKNAAIERLGIGFYHWWNEALHGYARSGTATVFPQAIGMAATWSPDLLKKVGDVASSEGRAKNNEELASRDGDLIRSLVGYGRALDMQPGEERTISIDIPLRRLALWNDDLKQRVVDAGEITFSAGPSSDRLELHETLTVPLG